MTYVDQISWHVCHPLSTVPPAEMEKFTCRWHSRWSRCCCSNLNEHFMCVLSTSSSANPLRQVEVMSVCDCLTIQELCLFVYSCVCVCVCIRVREREGERGREPPNQSGNKTLSLPTAVLNNGITGIGNMNPLLRLVSLKMCSLLNLVGVFFACIVTICINTGTIILKETHNYSSVK